MALQRARHNLVDFQILTSPTYTPNWHHDLIAKELEHIEAFGDRDYKILLVTVPPRNGKSQQCSIDFPAYYLGRNPEKEVIIASYSYDLAQDFGGKTRAKVDSLAFKEIFPEVSLKEDEKARGQWKTNKGGSYTSAGVGGAITGKGADIFFIDDPIKNREEAESETYREKTWDWFTSTAFTRLAPGGVMVIILTRWNLDDIAGRILSRTELAKRTKVMSFAAVAEKDERPYRLMGEPLWPSRFTYKALMEIKDTIGPYDWQALYQGNPILTADQEFKPQWIKTIPSLAVDAMETRNYLTIDTAMSKKAQADYTGFVDNRVNRENFWNVRAWGAKLSPEELVDNIFALHTQNKYIAIGIEKTTFTQGLKPYFDSEQRKRNTFLPFVELSHNSTAKEIRIRGLIPRYASGSIFHVEGQCKMLEDQMKTFPVGVHDDVIDALAYQLQLVDNPEVGNEVTVFIPDYD